MPSYADHPELCSLFERGDALCVVIQSAQHVPSIDLKETVAELQKVNRRIESIHATEFPRLHAELTLERVLLERATIAAIGYKWAGVGPGVPLLHVAPRFSEFAAFACAEMGITTKTLPEIVCVLKHHLPDRADGLYEPATQTVSVLAGSDDDYTRHVLGHEITHHHEALKGWTLNEEYAEHKATRLCTEWRERQRRPA
jgi:hypothetical protein